MLRESVKRKIQKDVTKNGSCGEVANSVPKLHKSVGGGEGDWNRRGNDEKDHGGGGGVHCIGQRKLINADTIRSLLKMDTIYILCLF
jgi:hypothetical protein